MYWSYTRCLHYCCNTELLLSIHIVIHTRIVRVKHMNACVKHYRIKQPVLHSACDFEWLTNNMTCARVKGGVALGGPLVHYVPERSTTTLRHCRRVALEKHETSVYTTPRLLSLNSWKTVPSPQKIEIVTYTHIGCCNRLLGYSGYSDIRKNLSIWIPKWHYSEK